MSHQPAYGEVHGPPRGEITRRSFMRRMLGVGIGILTLEFVGGTIAFLWPNITEGLGAAFRLGTADEIGGNAPDWATGMPYIFQPANAFVINVPAAMALVEASIAGQDQVSEPVPDPGDQVLALWRKCPHLGCQVPPLCDASKWFECLCHGSKYSVLGEKRDGPASRGMDRFPIRLEDGVYILDTSEVVSGPPPGTVTFDGRGPTEMPHCAG
jgi:cytochrome b6-f complex iron-sulfur subunit